MATVFDKDNMLWMSEYHNGSSSVDEQSNKAPAQPPQHNCLIVDFDQRLLNLPDLPRETDCDHLEQSSQCSFGNVGFIPVETEAETTLVHDEVQSAFAAPLPSVHSDMGSPFHAGLHWEMHAPAETRSCEFPQAAPSAFAAATMSDAHAGLGGLERPGGYNEDYENWTITDRIAQNKPPADQLIRSQSERCREYIEFIYETDVVFFKGNHNHVSRGTKKYLDLVKQEHGAFGRTSKRKEKAACKRKIMEYMRKHMGSRFVREERKSGRYYLLTEKETLDAIASSLWYAGWKVKKDGEGNNTKDCRTSDGKNGS